MTSISSICSGKSRRTGQAIIFLLLVLIILFFIAIWNFDLHKIIYTKSLSQNAGDSAAVMAARWQAISLNLVGDLNLMKAIALCNQDTNSADAINGIQARLCFTGPMIAFMGSQLAAKQNRMYRNADFEKILRQHIDEVRNDYPSQRAPDGSMLFPEPYPGAWTEYAAMLELVANEGIAAGPDNAQFYTDRPGSHYLLMPEFYDAIAGRQWCWFFIDGGNLLDQYDNFFPCWWTPLPPPPNIEYLNSEIFGLGLMRQDSRLSQYLSAAEADALAQARTLPGVISNAAVSATWYCYGPSWTRWDAIRPSGPDAFPVTGDLKPQYDYSGADAAIRIQAATDRLTPGPHGTVASDSVTWSAAAKPFGYLNDSDRPNEYGLVLPAFHDVRLIPVDTASGSGGGGYDLAWREHIEVHLPIYMQDGVGGIHSHPEMAACWYCQQLITWEDTLFRQTGIDWLEDNSHLCTLTSPGGGHHGGGSRRGH